jgi:hypothetical protein
MDEPHVFMNLDSIEPTLDAIGAYPHQRLGGIGQRRGGGYSTATHLAAYVGAGR